MNRDDLRAHERVMYRQCRRVIKDMNQIGCGGRVFWGLAEPKWRKALGFVGICSWCGDQTFTEDLLGRERAERGYHKWGDGWHRGEPRKKAS